MKPLSQITTRTTTTYNITGIWLIGWIFTWGFAHLDLWHGLLALIIWPYFLGTKF